MLTATSAVWNPIVRATNGNISFMTSEEDDKDPPPAYEASITSQECELEKLQHCDIESNEKFQEKLPSYQLATSLPSYDDSQGLKNDEEKQEAPKPFYNSFLNNRGGSTSGYVVGSNFEFILTFFVAFFFNWFGFFLGYCVLSSLAGRYGAISGFGLSMINWLVYLKYAKEGGAYVTDERWLLWWLFLGFAILVSTMGLLNWVKARRERDSCHEEREEGVPVLLY